MVENKNIINTYHISFNTYLIVPIKQGEKIHSQVYDGNGVHVVEQKPLYIVRNSCNVLGSNYNNAKNISKSFFGKEKHKLPIIITHDFGIPNVFFPLLSPSSPNNIWIGLHGIINIRRLKEFTEITLKDGRDLVLPINYSSFCSQYVCATMLQKYASNQRTTIRNEIDPSFETDATE